MGACKVQGVDNVIRLTNETGRLFSPLFPRPYPKDMTCTWIINVPEGHFVRLRMKSFRLFIDCDDSDLEIRDGESSSSTLLNQFCSRDYYISVFSSGRYMWVRFRSLRSVSSLDEAGFDAVFEAVKQGKVLETIRGLSFPKETWWLNWLVRRIWCNHGCVLRQNT